jgi:hypothetical protein
MTIRTGTVIIVLMMVMAGGNVPLASGQTPPSPRELLSRLPRSMHNSKIRVDAVPGTDRLRVWINPNEDDLRLYSPAGGQLDADIQISTTFTSGASPVAVDVLVETRGSTTPGPGPQTFVLVADGRSVAMTQRENDASRSGDLLFLSVEARLPMASVMQLATARRVDGRVWGVPFRFLDTQLELLRAFVWQVMDSEAR